MRNQKRHIGKLGLFPSIAVGTGTAVLLSFLLACAAATLMNTGRYDGSFELLTQLTIQFISSIAGTIVALAVSQEKNVLCVFSVITMYIFIMIAIAIMLFSGLSAAIFGGIVACYIAGFVSIFFVARKNGSAVKRKKRSPSR